jgi:hypothetical protein
MLLMLLQVVGAEAAHMHQVLCTYQQARLFL